MTTCIYEGFCDVIGGLSNVDLNRTQTARRHKLPIACPHQPRVRRGRGGQEQYPLLEVFVCFLLMGGDRSVRHPVGCLDYRPYVAWETRPHWFIALLQVVCLPMNMVTCSLARVPSFLVAQLGSCLGLAFAQQNENR